MTVNELLQRLVELARDGKGQWQVESDLCTCELCIVGKPTINVSSDKQEVYIGQNWELESD